MRDETGLERIFIPAKLKDNPCLLRNDPLYPQRLRQSGSEALVKAWLDGDWGSLEGAFFDCWNAAKHVLRTVSLPHDWPRLRSFDWGSARPFAVGWWAVVLDDWYHPDGQRLPRGALLRYREWYGKKKTRLIPIKGLN